MPVAGALIMAGGSIIGGQTAARAQEDATEAEERGQQRAIDAQLSMYGQQRADQMPWLQTGANSLALIAQILGIQPAGSGGGSAVNPASNAGVDPAERARRLQVWQDFQERYGPGTAPAAGGMRAWEEGRTAMWNANPWLSTFDPNNPTAGMAGGASGVWSQASGQPPASPINLTDILRNTPGYEFARSEGTRDIERMAAARGGLGSGGTLRALARYNTGLADQTYNNFLNRLFSVAGLGQTATGQIGSAGQATGANVANNLSNIGAIRGSGYANRGNIWGNAIGNAANAFGQYYGNQSQTTTVPSGGSGPYNQNVWMNYGYGNSGGGGP